MDFIIGQGFLRHFRFFGFCLSVRTRDPPGVSPQDLSEYSRTLGHGPRSSGGPGGKVSGQESVAGTGGEGVPWTGSDTSRRPTGQGCVGNRGIRESCQGLCHTSRRRH